MTWDQYTKQLLPEPRMVVAYKWPLRRLSMQLGYARMHQLIHRLRPQNLYQNNPDYWALSDNQSIPILRSDQFNFGVQKNFQHGQFQLDAFLRLQQGVTLFLGSLPGYDPSAAANDAALLIQGSGQNQGMEASYFFENKSHQVLISASFTKATSRFDQVDNQTIASSFVHLFEGKIYYEKQWKSWDYSCFWVMGSGLPYTPIGGSYTYTFPNGESTQMIGYGNYNSKRLSPYHRLDLSAHYLFDLKKTKLKIGASIYNVYNRTNIRSKIYFSYLNEDGDSQVYLVNQRMLGIVPSLQIELRF
jgi:hypothetical protein